MSLPAPTIYLSILSLILSIVGWFVFREVLRVRQQEKTITRLQSKLKQGTGSAWEHFELGSVYLQKKLYQLAVQQFKKSLEAGDENKPVVHNALGFTHFSTGQYDLAIQNYKEAIKMDPAYLTAWNNLGHAYEMKKQIELSVEAYKEVLTLSPDNQIARRRLDSLEKRLGTDLSNTDKALIENGPDTN